eukprot:NODE_17827_length_924_cov_2.184442.p5 GENE.NODE_17827_length_924_cov_2.184442~~NODE_17827_length_924_cov_2.184442.p5  ORF type:complete len:50 (+),score=8.43 NODE_17827_length_924_cov_2.184442:223-372(+)
MGTASSLELPSNAERLSLKVFAASSLCAQALLWQAAEAAASRFEVVWSS